MKKSTMSLIFISVMALSNGVFAQGTSGKNSQSFKVGSVPILFPSPSAGLVEAGYENRERLEVLVPAQHRLICAFLLENELKNLEKGEANGMKEYALIEILRKGEFLDVSPSDFNELVKAAGSDFGGMAGPTFKECEDEINRRLKSMDESSIQLGTPVQLGTFFSKKDAHCLGMLMTMQQESRTLTMAMSCSFLRVKQRVLFVYFYEQYEDRDTIRRLGETTEKWVDEILKKNK